MWMLSVTTFHRIGTVTGFASTRSNLAAAWENTTDYIGRKQPVKGREHWLRCLRRLDRRATEKNMVNWSSIAVTFTRFSSHKERVPPTDLATISLTVV